MVVIIANAPAHYRSPVFDLLPSGNGHVIYCSRREPSRDWQEPPLAHAATFLKERFRHRPDGVSFVHDNPDVWGVLDRLRPTVVVIGGLNPTHLYAAAWAVLHGARLVYMTDGTPASEAGLSWRHRALRRLVFRFCSAFLVASAAGEALLRSYGVREHSIGMSALCAPPPDGVAPGFADREFDVMFCGRLHAGKMPAFFVNVCRAIRARRGSCRALLVGDGPERAATLAQMTACGLDAVYRGFVEPGLLRRQYASARLLLFPTRQDTWGLVANEAMSAGTPVITMAAAGCAGELVLDGRNGCVRPPDVDAWARAACELLEDPLRWARYSAAALEDVGPYNYGRAAEGILRACGIHGVARTPP